MAKPHAAATAIAAGSLNSTLTIIYAANGTTFAHKGVNRETAASNNWTKKVKAEG